MMPPPLSQRTLLSDLEQEMDKARTLNLNSEGNTFAMHAAAGQGLAGAGGRAAASEHALGRTGRRTAEGMGGR